jgi:hypothetical protein
MKVRISVGRGHQWEVRSVQSSEVLFSSNNAADVDSFINDNGHALPHGPSTLEGDLHEREMIDRASRISRS